MEVLANAVWQEKEIKGIQIGKEEIKLSLFVDDMIIYVRTLKEWTKKTPITNNWLQKVARYKINIQKSVAFLCTSNE